MFFSQNIFSENENYILEKNISNGFNTPINLITLNTVEDDFAPFYNHQNNELIFNSIHKKYSKYFVSKITPYNDFSSPKLLNSLLNENRQNRSYFTLLDEKQALVSAFNRTKSGSFLNIQKSIYERNSWSAPSPIPEFSDSFFIAHPTISPNGEMLVFASNKNNPQKKTDLWFAAKQSDGSWNMMLPIDELNSNGNEITPFFVSDSLLIFASDGFEGIGGFDLYYSFFSAGRWSKPHPLGGINTEFNESDPAALPNGTLIFASDKPGGKGKLDLYSATVIINETSEEPEIPFSVSATTFTVDVTKLVKYDLTVKPASTNADSSRHCEDLSEAISDDNEKRLPHLSVRNDEKCAEITFEVFPNLVQFFIKNDVDLQRNNINNKNENYENYIYEYKLFCDENLLYENYISFFQEDFTLNFDVFSSKIFYCDSLILEISLKNSKSEKSNFTRNINIELAKKESRELIKHQINNEEFYRVLTFFSDDINEYKKINEGILSQIGELIFRSKKVNFLAKDLDKNFINELKKLLNIKQQTNIIKSFDTDEKYLELQIFPR